MPMSAAMSAQATAQAASQARMAMRQGMQPAQPQIVQQPVPLAPVVQAPPQFVTVPQMPRKPQASSAPMMQGQVGMMMQGHPGMMKQVPQQNFSNPQEQPREVTKEVPVCAYDVRTVLVPKTVIEDYAVMETRMVAMLIPVNLQRTKWTTEPRNISIPRPMVEKRIVRKMVPKVIQVEEVSEIECSMTAMKTFFVGADTSGDGMLSYAEWQAANAAQGYGAATTQRIFQAEKDADGDGQVSMEEMMAW